MQECKNPQTINYHTCTMPCIFMAIEVVDRIMDYHVNVHILHVLQFTLNQMQGNSVQHLLMDL